MRVPRGMRDLAKMPRPLMPAWRISYIDMERKKERRKEREMSCEVSFLEISRGPRYPER